MEFVNQIICGDCAAELRQLPDNSIDLIFTSPPYADQRRNTYRGIKPADYVDWFLPKSEEFLRVLKPTGTFILNIKERVVKGRTLYLCDRVDPAHARAGGSGPEEFIWHKELISGQMAQSLS